MRIVECTVLQLMLNEEFVESAGTLCIGGRHRSRASNDALVVASFEGGGGLEGVSGRGKASRAGAGLRTTPTTLRYVTPNYGPPTRGSCAAVEHSAGIPSRVDLF